MNPALFDPPHFLSCFQSGTLKKKYAATPPVPFTDRLYNFSNERTWEKGVCLQHSITVTSSSSPLIGCSLPFPHWPSVSHKLVLVGNHEGQSMGNGAILLLASKEAPARPRKSSMVLSADHNTDRTSQTDVHTAILCMLGGVEMGGKSANIMTPPPDLQHEHMPTTSLQA